MANAPAFTATPNNAAVSVSSANTAIDGTGTITTLIQGAATGTLVQEIVAQCAATAANALVNIFLSTDSGTTWRLYDQIAITAATPSTTVKANRNNVAPVNLRLKDATHRIGVTTTIAQATNVFAHGGDF